MSFAKSLSDRVCGCLLAGAIGDAMGGPFEGQAGPIKYCEHFNWKFSDDTQLTLATCEAVRDARGVSPELIAAKFREEFQERRLTGLGASTFKAMRDLEAGAHWALAGARGERAAGSGAAMRVAPLAFILDPEKDEDRVRLRDVCRITHHHDEAYAGALAVVKAVRLLIHPLAGDGDDFPVDFLSRIAQSLPDCQVRDRLLRLAGLSSNMVFADVANQYPVTGFVVDVVPLAILAVYHFRKQPLEQLLRQLISAGGDTDTTASIAGQIAGSFLGAARLPLKLFDLLPERVEIERVGRGFAEAIPS